MDLISRQLAEDWAASDRPLLIFDEVRWTENEVEFTAFIFLLTKTNTAHLIANDFVGVREHLCAPLSDRVFKATGLWPRNKPWPAEMAGLRGLVAAALGRVTEFGVFIGTNEVIHLLRTDAPGGIRAVSTIDGSVTEIRGREIVPFRNAVKRVALDRFPGAERIDVLVDSSGQLGTDQVLPTNDSVSSFEPDTWNEAAPGRPEPVQCASRFGLVVTKKRTMFRDLILLPDAVGHFLRGRNAVTARMMDEVLGADTFLGDRLPTSLFEVGTARF